MTEQTDGLDMERTLATEITRYLGAYTLPANYSKPLAPTERHWDVAERCGPQIAAHVAAVLREQIAAAQAEALLGFRDHCLSKAVGGPVAPGCPAAADYAFWMRVVAEVDLHAALVAPSRVIPPATLLLPDRHGNPIEVPNECAECGGDGLNAQGGVCRACDGSGLVSRAACETCGGATAVTDGETVCVSGSRLPHPPTTRISAPSRVPGEET